MESKGEAIKLRRATENDLEEIARLFSQNNFGLQRLDWLKWKYLENPDGPASIFVAEDAVGKIIATSVRLPHRFTSKQTGDIRTCQHIDVFTASEYRRKRVFAKLLDYDRDKRDYFLMGFPNDRSRIVKELDRVIPLEDWIFPVALSKSKPAKEVPFFGLFADLLSRTYALAWLGRRYEELQMEEIKRFQTDYTVPSSFIHGTRTAAFLNWRFIDNPIFKYFAYEFPENSEPVGYCVYAISGSGVEVFDLICNRRQRGCIRLLVDHCRSRGFTHINFKGANLKLKPYGFFSHQSSEDCIIASIPNGPGVPEGPWLLTLADRDV